MLVENLLPLNGQYHFFSRPPNLLSDHGYKRCDEGAGVTKIFQITTNDIPEDGGFVEPPEPIVISRYQYNYICHRGWILYPYTVLVNFDYPEIDKIGIVPDYLEYEDTPNGKKALMGDWIGSPALMQICPRTFNLDRSRILANDAVKLLRSKKVLSLLENTAGMPNKKRKILSELFA